MASEPNNSNHEHSVELPAPTVAPLVVSLGVAFSAAGVAMSSVFVLVGVLIFIVGLAMWINQLLPGRGHCHEPFVEPEFRPDPITPARGTIERLEKGMPGYRLRLPEQVHPISAGIKGGIVGGLIMPIPAAVYGLLSGHGIWLPINLLAGMALPGVGDLSTSELEQFRPTLLILGTGIHIVVSLILGLLYGVLMPTLPSIPKPISWGALFMPVLWTAASFIALQTVNPTGVTLVDWPWFVASQFVFGVVAATVFLAFERRNRVTAGLLGGIVGGLLMPAPALLWGLLSKHGIWYPINLLAAMAVRHADELSVARLEQFNADWFVAAVIMHAVLSLSFGLAFGVVLPKLPVIPAPLAWGGLVMPLLWTASSYSLMGIVNPALQQHVDWPWFIASQFVFGVVAAIVVVQSEMVHIPPAGRGVDQPSGYFGE